MRDSTAGSSSFLGVSMRISTRPPAAPTRVTCCLTCKWRHWHELAALDDPDLTVLDDARSHHNYRSGQHLFRRGSACLGLHAVSTGVIGIRKNDARGNSVLVRLAFPGEMVGYRTFFSGGTYTGEAQALMASSVCFFEAGAVRDVLARNSLFSRKFLDRMARDLQASEQHYLEQASLPVRARVANLLLKFKDQCGVADARGQLTLSLPVSRQDIGEMLGIRPETIARAIHQLQQDGVANFGGRTVQVPDLDKLLDEVESHS